jgi:hypothetical protein
MLFPKPARTACAERRSAMPKGFRERFEQVLGACEFPIAVSEVRLASNPLEATAKGALIAALADQ